MADEDEKTTALLSSRSSQRMNTLRMYNNNSLHVDDLGLGDDDDTEESRSATVRAEEGEWIECQEIVSGRRLFYNSITLEISFDHNPSKTSNNSKDKNNKNKKGDNDDILSQDIACDDVTDDEIVQYLLKFSKSKWDFNNPEVDIYRLQCNNIDHKLMLPHPISMSFPEFFSTNTIPKKKLFVALVLPPKDNTQFPSMSKNWKVKVIVQETTAKQLIDKIVDKLKVSLNTSEYGGDANDIIKKSSEFILKVVGSEEYILYDDTKLIVDYEAVRKAVRNEDDVIFQLDHRPDLTLIEQECFDKNIWHIQKFDKKYFTANLLTEKIVTKHREKHQSLLYCKHSYGDGKSLDEIILAKRHNGFTKPYQLQQHQQMKSKQQPILSGAGSEEMSGNELMSDDDIDYKLDFSNNIPGPPPGPPPPVNEPLPNLHANSAFSVTKKKSIALTEEEEEDIDTDKEESVPPPPPLPSKGTNANTTKGPHNNDEFTKNGHQKNESGGPQGSFTPIVNAEDVQGVYHNFSLFFFYFLFNFSMSFFVLFFFFLLDLYIFCTCFYCARMTKKIIFLYIFFLFINSLINSIFPFG